MMVMQQRIFLMLRVVAQYSDNKDNKTLGRNGWKPGGKAPGHAKFGIKLDQPDKG